MYIWKAVESGLTKFDVTPGGGAWSGKSCKPDNISGVNAAIATTNNDETMKMKMMLMLKKREPIDRCYWSWNEIPSRASIRSKVRPS